MDGQVLLTPILPYGGALADQDAETMLAFELLDETYRSIETARERRRAAKEMTVQMGAGQPVEAPPPPPGVAPRLPSSGVAPPAPSKHTFSSTAERGIPQHLPIPVIQ